MSYEQYAQIETQVLEMPYEKKIQLLSVIVNNLKNIKALEDIHLHTKKQNVALVLLFLSEEF